MFKKHSRGPSILILTLVLFLSACTGAQPSLPATSEATPVTTQPPPTATPTEEPPTAAPTEVPPTAMPTEEPPTATPTEEPIELNPSPRGYISMAYDTESKQVILFGGQTGDFDFPENYSGETWAFDLATQTWTEMKPATAPSPRAAANLTYDAESDRVILYGGALVYTTYQDTWAYDYNSNTWTEMKAQGPAKHLGSAMAYDTESDRSILFGGYDLDADVLFQDTWAYDYNSDSWSELMPEISPPNQNYHAMTYNTKADRVILWGGDTTPRDNSVWAYDFNTNIWQQEMTSTGPDARPYHAMAYSGLADQNFMYGGKGTGNKEMWSYNYDSNTWTMLEEPGSFPGALSRYAMVYIPDTDRFIVFGGQVGGNSANYTNQTWLYDLNTNTWTDVTRIP